MKQKNLDSINRMLRGLGLPIIPDDQASKLDIDRYMTVWQLTALVIKLAKYLNSKNHETL